MFDYSYQDKPRETLNKHYRYVPIWKGGGLYFEVYYRDDVDSQDWRLIKQPFETVKSGTLYRCGNCRRPAKITRISADHRDILECSVCDNWESLTGNLNDLRAR